MNNLPDLVRSPQPTRRQATTLTLTGLALAATVTTANAALSDMRSVSDAQRAADQQTLLNLINTFRAQNGLAPVKHSATVAGVMRSEAERQVRASAFSHGTEFIYNPKVQGYSFVREVIALSYNDDLSVLVNFWKNSPAHRAAVLAPEANVIGIGLAYGYGTSLPWRVLGNVGIYRYEAGRGPNDYVSSITAPQAAAVDDAPTYALRGGIANHYYTNGGAATYGQPTGNEFSSINGGYIQNFSNNRTIYWTPQYGAHTIYWPGAIGGKYAGNNFESGWGYPMNSEYRYWGASRQDFSKNGYVTSVYWTPQTGACAIGRYGAISARWHAMGGPAALGFPATDEVRHGDGVVRVTFTTGTTINWSETRGTWVS